MFGTMRTYFIVIALFLSTSCARANNPQRGKRAMAKWHEKPQADKWVETFFERNPPFDHTSSLVNLLNAVTEQYLTDCALTVLYDDATKSNANLLLEKLFKQLFLPHMQGEFTQSYAIANRKLLTPPDNTCLNYLVFMEDVMRCQDVINAQSTNKVIVVARSSQWRVHEFLGSASAQNFVNIMVVSLSEKAVAYNEELPFILYTHKMFIDGIGSSTPHVITSWYKGRFARPIRLFPRKMKEGFSGHRFIASLASQPPFVIKRGRDDNDNVEWDGIEVRLMKLLAEIYNFTTDFREAINADILGVGDAITNDLRSQKSSLGLGGLYVVPERLKYTGMSFGYTQDCAAFISLTSTALPRWRAIMGPFHWSVWLTLIFIYVFAMFPLSFSDRHTLKYLLSSPEELENMFWYVFGTFTNCFTFKGKNTWTKSSKIATRLLIGFYWLFSIIITACYTGSIIAFVTLPIFPDTVETAKQLVKGHYQIGTLDKGGWQYWFENSSDPVATKLFSTIEYVPTIELGVRNTSKAFFWSYAFLGSRYQLDYLVRSNFTTKSKRSLYHISSECFVPFSVGVMFTKESVIKNIINKGIMHAVESGFVKKFHTDIKWHMLRTATGRLLQASSGGSLRELAAADRALVLDDTQGMFLLLATGFLAGGISLISEWFGGCFNFCKGRRNSTTSSSITTNPRSYDAPTPRQKLDSRQFQRSSFLGIIEDNEIVNTVRTNEKTEPNADANHANLLGCKNMRDQDLEDHYYLADLFGETFQHDLNAKEQLATE